MFARSKSTAAPRRRRKSRSSSMGCGFYRLAMPHNPPAVQARSPLRRQLRVRRRSQMNRLWCALVLGAVSLSRQRRRCACLVARQHRNRRFRRPHVPGNTRQFTRRRTPVLAAGGKGCALRGAGAQYLGRTAGPGDRRRRPQHHQRQALGARHEPSPCTCWTPGTCRLTPGWRASLEAVNEFYFTDWKDSYAEAFGDRSARGVIAVAVYREVPPPRPVYQPYLKRPESLADSGRACRQRRLRPRRHARRQV